MTSATFVWQGRCRCEKLRMPTCRHAKSVGIRLLVERDMHCAVGRIVGCVVRTSGHFLVMPCTGSKASSHMSASLNRHSALQAHNVHLQAHMHPHALNRPRREGRESLRVACMKVQDACCCRCRCNSCASSLQMLSNFGLRLGSRRVQRVISSAHTVGTLAADKTGRAGSCGAREGSASGDGPAAPGPASLGALAPLAVADGL